MSGPASIEIASEPMAERLVFLDVKGAASVASAKKIKKYFIGFIMGT